GEHFAGLKFCAPTDEARATFTGCSSGGGGGREGHTPGAEARVFFCALVAKAKALAYLEACRAGVPRRLTPRFAHTLLRGCWKPCPFKAQLFSAATEALVGKGEHFAGLKFCATTDEARATFTGCS